MEVFTGQTLPRTGRNKRCWFHVPVNINSVLFYFSDPSSVLSLWCWYHVPVNINSVLFYFSDPSSVLSLWAKSTRTHHPKVTPLHLDHLAAPTNLCDWAQHRMGPPVTKSCWQADLQPNQSLSSLDLWQSEAASCNPPFHRWIQRIVRTDRACPWG